MGKEQEDIVVELRESGGVEEFVELPSKAPEMMKLTKPSRIEMAISRCFEVAVEGLPSEFAVLKELASQVGYFVTDTNAQTLLHACCSSGNLEWVKWINKVQKRRCLNAVDNHGWTPIMYAADKGHLHICDYLLQFKKVSVLNRTKNMYTLLHLVAYSTTKRRQNDKLMRKILEVLVDLGCPACYRSITGETVLHSAALAGNIVAIMYFMENGLSNAVDEDEKGEKPLDCALKSKDQASIEYLLERGCPSPFSYELAQQVSNEEIQEKIKEKIFHYTPAICTLPIELITEIAKELPLQSIFLFLSTCKYFQFLKHDNKFWQRILNDKLPLWSQTLIPLLENEIEFSALSYAQSIARAKRPKISIKKLFINVTFYSYRDKTPSLLQQFGMRDLFSLLAVNVVQCKIHGKDVAIDFYQKSCLNPNGIAPPSVHHDALIVFVQNDWWGTGVKEMQLLKTILRMPSNLTIIFREIDFPDEYTKRYQTLAALCDATYIEYSSAGLDRQRRIELLSTALEPLAISESCETDPKESPDVAPKSVKKDKCIIC